MTVSPPAVGRRERNKQAKRERIIAAASTLFAEHGVDDVTTQQIADAADIGTGTLFLYARTKGELLLLVQNTHYERALADGRAAAETASSPVDAILALTAPIVACNRVQIENGRTYLREMLFGDATEPHHAEARRIVTDTDTTLRQLLTDLAGRSAEEAAVLAGVISSAMFVSMAAAPAEAAVEEILAGLRTQIATVLGADR
ncbi:MAG: TetR/AcrR family transcriptional regulator [Candidatus Microbacterium phytovorans]|uniref:TetR/AcrR family transcriptional regulator n=1 Tax=Candidatus Microbacterium phytovorans TaxID=3121374 RepID=A0AAJ5W1M1_9MICO|nr:TetR/AcrR family transcriptional regulator [Microbacterium sp.]WEK12976.1 MAG: TetR/AcrR family transcriptional regulator [Microbacterium sp.]